MDKEKEIDPLVQAFIDHDPSYKPELDDLEVDSLEVEDAEEVEEVEDIEADGIEDGESIEEDEEEEDYEEEEEEIEDSADDIAKELEDMEREEFSLEKEESSEEDSWKPEDWNDKKKYPAIRKENLEKSHKIKKLETEQAESVKAILEKEQELEKYKSELKELKSKGGATIDPEGYKDDPDFKQVYSSVESQINDSRVSIESLLGKSPSVLTDLTEFTEASYALKELSGDPQASRNYIRDKAIEAMGLQGVASDYLDEDGNLDEDSFTEELTTLQTNRYITTTEVLMKAIKKGSDSIDSLAKIKKDYEENTDTQIRKVQITNYSKQSQKIKESLSTSGILDEEIMEADPYSFETHVSKSLIENGDSEHAEKVRKAIIEYNVGHKPLTKEHIKYYEEQGRKPEEVEKLLKEASIKRKESLNKKFYHYLLHEKEIKEAWSDYSKRKIEEKKKSANAKKIRSAESAPTSRSKETKSNIDPLDQLWKEHGISF